MSTLLSAPEFFEAAYSALKGWRDECAPGASIMVQLTRWEHPENQAHSKTTAKLHVAFVEGIVASAETESGDIPAALVALTNNKASRAAEYAKLMAVNAKPSVGELVESAIERAAEKTEADDSAEPLGTVEVPAEEGEPE